MRIVTIYSTNWHFNKWDLMCLTRHPSLLIECHRERGASSTEADAALKLWLADFSESDASGVHRLGRTCDNDWCSTRTYSCDLERCLDWHMRSRGKSRNKSERMRRRTREKMFTNSSSVLNIPWVCLDTWRTSTRLLNALSTAPKYHSLLKHLIRYSFRFEPVQLDCEILSIGSYQTVESEALNSRSIEHDEHQYFWSGRGADPIWMNRRAIVWLDGGGGFQPLIAEGNLLRRRCYPACLWVGQRRPLSLSLSLFLPVTCSTWITYRFFHC